MKKISTLLFLLTISIAFSQDFSDLNPNTLKSQEDLKKNEGRILECANYILTNPIDSKNNVRKDAMAAVIVWMSNTSAYTFIVDESIAPLMKKNDDVLGLYMAAMTKFVLENPEKSKDTKEIKLNGFQLMLEFCNSHSNNVKISKELKKAIDAMLEGKLNEYLKL